jgi:hypothetical protein
MQRAVVRIDPVTGDRTIVSDVGTGSGPMIVAHMGIVVEASGDFLVAGILVVSGVPLGVIVRVDSVTGDRAIVSGAGVGEGEVLASPSSMAVEASGDLVVTDFTRAAVLRVDLATGRRTIVSSPKAGQGPVSTPAAIVVEATGDLLVTDFGLEGILRVDPVTGDRTLLSSCPAPGSSFCDASDGSLASCPCTNPGAPNSGCEIAQGTGGVALAFVSQQTSPNNRVTWASSGFPALGAPTSLAIRGAALASSSPVVFGDGLICVGAPVVRLTATFASGGSATHVHGHGAETGTFYYQLWFRHTPASFCDPAAAFSLSNGQRLTW